MKGIVNKNSSEQFFKKQEGMASTFGKLAMVKRSFWLWTLDTRDSQ